MVCDLCAEREAVIFLEQKSPSGIRKINLCPECAAERGIQAPQVVSSQQNVAAVFEEVFRKNAKTRLEFSRLCPGCGKSLGEIKSSGFAGCPECYSVFSEELKMSFSEHGITGVYSGSLPKRVRDFRNALTDRADLQAKLEEAVKEENYEKAAVYRDFLRALEKPSVSDGEEFRPADDGKKPGDEKKDRD